jgi:hypothetical protein
MPSITKIVALILLCALSYGQEVGLPSGPIPGPGVVFIPLPDPAVPETMNQANINQLKAWGVIQVSAFATPSEVLKITGVIPAEGESGKYWSDTKANIWRDYKRYEYLRVEGSMPAGAVNYSDDSFRYGYSPAAVKLYRSGYPADLIPAVPILRRTGDIGYREAGRLNLGKAASVPFPIGGFMDSGTGEILEGSTFPQDKALRCRPKVAGCLVEVFDIQAFARTYPAPTGTSPPSTTRLSTPEFLSFVAEIMASGLPAEEKRTLITRTATQ